MCHWWQIEAIPEPSAQTHLLHPKGLSSHRLCMPSLPRPQAASLGRRYSSVSKGCVEAVTSPAQNFASSIFAERPFLATTRLILSPPQFFRPICLYLNWQAFYNDLILWLSLLWMFEDSHFFWKIYILFYSILFYSILFYDIIISDMMIIIMLNPNLLIANTFFTVVLLLNACYCFCCQKVSCF